MSTKHCLLDGRKIHSIDTACQQLAQDLEFPDWFHPNLDALWDVLTTEIAGPIDIVWHSYHKSRQVMPEDYHRLSSLLRQAAKERDDLSYKRTKKAL